MYIHSCLPIHISDSYQQAPAALTTDELEEEFDPEEYDRKMEAMFGEEFYEDMQDDEASIKKMLDEDEDLQMVEHRVLCLQIPVAYFLSLSLSVSACMYAYM